MTSIKINLNPQSPLITINSKNYKPPSELLLEMQGLLKEEQLEFKQGFKIELIFRKREHKE